MTFGNVHQSMERALVSATGNFKAASAVEPLEVLGDFTIADQVYL